VLAGKSDSTNYWVRERVLQGSGSGTSEAANKQADHHHLDPGFTLSWQEFVILAQAARAAQPGERSCHLSCLSRTENQSTD